MDGIGVYILRCSDNRFYIGSTDSIERRLEEHELGMVRSTQRKLPVTLALFFPCVTLFKARSIEYRLKRMKSHVLLERMVSEQTIKFAEK